VFPDASRQAGRSAHGLARVAFYVPGCPRMHAGRCEFKSSDKGKPHTRPFADMPGHHPGAGGRQRRATGGLIPPLPPGQGSEPGISWNQHASAHAP